MAASHKEDDRKKHRRREARTACWDWLDSVLGVPKRLPQVPKVKWHPLACFTEGAIRKLRKTARSTEEGRSALGLTWVSPNIFLRFLEWQPLACFTVGAILKLRKTARSTEERRPAQPAGTDLTGSWVSPNVSLRFLKWHSLTCFTEWAMGDLAADRPAWWRWAYLGLWQSSSQLQMISPTLARWRWAYLGSAMLKPAKSLIRKLWRTARNTEEGRCALGLTWRAPGCPQTSPSGSPGWGRSLQAARWLPASPMLSLPETCPSIKQCKQL